MVRRFLAEKSPVSEVRRLMATEAGYDPAVWAQLGRLGLAGLTVPEEYGGAGRGPVEQLIVCEEMGAALLCAPYLASAVLAPWALRASASVDRLIPRAGLARRRVPTERGQPWTGCGRRASMCTRRPSLACPRSCAELPSPVPCDGRQKLWALPNDVGPHFHAARPSPDVTSFLSR